MKVERIVVKKREKHFQFPTQEMGVKTPKDGSFLGGGGVGE
jgi:hypothetical protein